MEKNFFAPEVSGGTMPVVKPQGAMVEIEQSRSIAETQAAMIIAKRFPRDEKLALDRILMACTRPTLADQALYSYARGGTEITGPSIRMAEAIAQCWGNLQFGIRELEQRNGESTVEAYAWDVETNTRQVKVFQVAHKRATKKGTYALEDPRDIYEMVANQGARRLRACILGIIPGDVIETAVDQCEATLKNKAEATPERIQSMLESFATYKVTKEMIETRIQRRIDAITPALLVQLGKIYNSIKDGMSVAADWFEIAQAEEKQTGNEALKSKLSGKGKETSPPPPAEEPKMEADVPLDPPPAAETSGPAQSDIRQTKITGFKKEIDACKTAANVDTWRSKHNKRVDAAFKQDDDAYTEVMSYANDRFAALSQGEAAGLDTGSKLKL